MALKFDDFINTVINYNALFPFIVNERVNCVGHYDTVSYIINRWEYSLGTKVYKLSSLISPQITKL